MSSPPCATSERCHEPTAMCKFLKKITLRAACRQLVAVSSSLLLQVASRLDPLLQLEVHCEPQPKDHGWQLCRCRGWCGCRWCSSPRGTGNACGVLGDSKRARRRRGSFGCDAAWRVFDGVHQKTKGPAGGYESCPKRPPEGAQERVQTQEQAQEAGSPADRS